MDELCTTNRSKRPGSDDDAANGDPTVYVVDDDRLMLAALKRLFTVSRMSVEVYASGEELLRDCRFAPPGALLLDVNMPGMTGLELQKRLLERGVTLPIVFLTGSGDIPMAVEALRNGAVDFLEKPFENAKLVDRVRKAFAETREPRTGAGADDDYTRRKRSLTPRECEVLELMITGMSNKLMGRELGVSHRTVEIHRAKVMEKMDADSLADLVRMSLEADLMR
jgi:FixJ family two-component response regulator